MHDVLATPWGRPDEDDPAKHGRPLKRHALGNHPAERVTEDVAAFYGEAVEKGQRVRAHTADSLGNRTARSTDPGVVKENHLPPFRERVRHCRVPVVEGTCEVLQTQKRRPRSLAEAAVSVPRAAGVDELGHRRNIASSRSRRHMILREVA